MAKELKLRRGTTAEHSTFTGAEGEVTVDTTKDTVVVHDGATAGGVPLAKEADIPTGALASLDSVDASTIDDNSVGAAELNVPGNGTAGQYLASDGDGTMTWTTLASGGGDYQMQVFSNPGTWTKPAGCNAVKVTVIGGGGGSTGGNVNVPSGGTSSFGAFCSATGGSGSGYPGNNAIAAPGVGSGGQINLRGNYVSQFGQGPAHGGRKSAEAALYSVSANYQNSPNATGGDQAGTGFGTGGLSPQTSGGAGGTAVEYLDANAIPGPVAVTVGGAGNNLYTIQYASLPGGVIVEWWE